MYLTGTQKWVTEVEQTGSLMYFFALLEKTRLGGEHPDYHSLLSSLTQIRDGLLLNAWRTECGNLKQYSESRPSPKVLLSVAQRILLKYATAAPKSDIRETESSEEEGDSNTDTDSDAQIQHDDSPNKERVQVLTSGDDVAHHNLRLLTRDLLYLGELIQAISDGDIGRIEDILPQLAMMFRGAGGNNYCTEILHFIFNLKHVWTPEFAFVLPQCLKFCQLMLFQGYHAG